MCWGCTGINIGEGFLFFIFWRNKVILMGILVDWTPAIFFCTAKGCTQKLLFVFIF